MCTRNHEGTTLILVCFLILFGVIGYGIWSGSKQIEERKAFLRENECTFSHTEVTDEWKWFGKPAVKEYLHNEVYDCRSGQVKFAHWRRK